MGKPGQGRTASFGSPGAADGSSSAFRNNSSLPSAIRSAPSRVMASPKRSNQSMSPVMMSGRLAPRMRIRPPVMPAATMKPEMSTWSGDGRKSTVSVLPSMPPVTVTRLVLMPSICAPRSHSRSSRSRTCGSQAASTISTVVPVPAAYMATFSVAVTLASGSQTVRRGRSPRGEVNRR